MSKKCITDDTKLFDIKTDKIISHSELGVRECELLSKQISDETGVPKELIYKEPFLFFINCWHKVDGEWYFYKGGEYDFYFINELLGEIISEYFELDTVHYSVARLMVKDKPDDFGVVSKNFCDKNFMYKRTLEYDLYHKADLSTLEDLRYICNSDDVYLDLLKDIKKLFIRDFYAVQRDRGSMNFLFKEKDNVIRLAPLYDYEASFESDTLHVYKNQLGTLNIKYNPTRERLLNDDMFQELLNLLMSANVLSMLTQCEDRHKICVPQDLKKHYVRMETEVKKLVLENKVIR